MLVDDLRLVISCEQNTEVVEGRHVALQLDAVHKKHGHRNSMILKVPEEHILDRLNPLYWHAEFSSLILVTAVTVSASL